MEEMSMTMKALQAGLSAEGVTMYLFWLGIVGMGAGSLYLFMMQSTFRHVQEGRHRGGNHLCGGLLPLLPHVHHLRGIAGQRDHDRRGRQCEHW